jgi:hypothetical protein
MKERSLSNDKAFTRKRKMGFAESLCFQLDMCKTGLQARLNNFFWHRKGGEPISQPAFTKLRAQYDETPFEIMTRDLVEEEYSGRHELPTWRGFHLIANDGSYAQLPTTPELAEEFGVRGGGNRPSAGISVLFDVLHGWAIDPIITHTGMNEREQLGKHVSYLCGILPNIAKNTLLLLDRGYPSQAVFKMLEENGLRFCARCANDFTTEIRDAPMGSSVVTLGSGQTVRVVKFPLKPGQVETLVSNLFDLPEADFPALYAKRWGIETMYHRIKRVISIEKFSGRLPNTIRQDFWASMVIFNVAVVFQNEADEIVRKRHEEKNLKHKNRVRFTNLIITLRDRFIFSVLLDDSPARERQLDSLFRDMTRVLSPERPGRSHPRNPKPFAAANHNL